MTEKNDLDNANNITQEQVLEAIKKNLEQNKKVTRDFEQGVYSEIKDDLIKIQELVDENK